MAARSCGPNTGPTAGGGPHKMKLSGDRGWNRPAWRSARPSSRAARQSKARANARPHARIGQHPRPIAAWRATARYVAQVASFPTSSAARRLVHAAQAAPAVAGDSFFRVLPAQPLASRCVICWQLLDGDVVGL